MTNGLNYDIGDTVTSDNKESKIFRRDCRVVYVDRALLGVITDGILNVVFLPYDHPSIRMVKRGDGYLEKEQKEKLAEIMKHWGFAGFVSGLPKLVEKTRDNLEFDSNDKMYIRMDGFVPKELGLAWKQFMALIDMMKQTNPELPNYINTLMFEWILSGALTTLKFSSVFKHFLESGGSEDKD